MFIYRIYFDASNSKGLEEVFSHASVTEVRDRTMALDFSGTCIVHADGDLIMFLVSKKFVVATLEKANAT